ncbi:MAG: hypothetical protein E7113_05085 [Bacteroidales bacterium]|nr:hypothetical protein [Bacteroidales bacterium]
MCSDKLISSALLFLTICSCSSVRTMQRITSGEVRMEISVPYEKPLDEGVDKEVRIDSIRRELSGEPFIMNAIRDAETGEMVATDVISAATVVARFRNVAERGGTVSIGFDVRVPDEMASSSWQLKLFPLMRIQDDTLRLDPVFITGEGYRKGQLKGYQRYRDFLASIITDTTDLIRVGQLEIFMQRNFPETYAMKTDSSLVSEPMAENLFGVTQAEALRHYTKSMKMFFNEKKKARADLMYEKYVKDPIVTEGIRLDTVLTSSDGDFIYRYTQSFRSRPGLKKVMVDLEGEIYEDGVSICSLPFPEELTFYISSLSTMADMTPKYRMVVLERNVYDNTKALIDFEKGSHRLDSSLSDNASEMARILRCIDDVVSLPGYVLDSLIVNASCSPEGTYDHNRLLASARSESMKEYIWTHIPDQWQTKVKTSSVPENWEQFRKLVANDTIIGNDSRQRILALTENLMDPDKTESGLSGMAEYRYLREKIYPQLRSVSFDFYLHRPGMQKDTLHTTELDEVYMSGLAALADLDYKTAVEKLRPYRDYNAALAFMAAGYDHSALDVLNGLEDGDARVCYLKALVLSRLGVIEEAVRYYELSLTYDPYLEHRANLDPEMSEIINKTNPN